MTDRLSGRNTSKPPHVENPDQMRFRARYGEDGPDPRWPSLRLENLREVSARPAIAVADVHLSEHRQRLLDVALCTDGAVWWAALPPGFQPADTTVDLGYQASIVLEFLAELGMTE